MSFLIWLHFTATSAVHKNLMLSGVKCSESAMFKAACRDLAGWYDTGRKQAKLIYGQSKFFRAKQASSAAVQQSRQCECEK